MSRVAQVFGLVVVIMVAVGAGFLLSSPAQAPISTGAQPAHAALEQLWEAPLTDLPGQPAPLSRWKGKPLIVNFWASWCPPCIKEMPLFSRLQEKHPHVQFVGIAIDSRENVQAFSARQPVSYPVLLGESTMGLMTDLGNTRGGLPFTLVLGADGKIRSTRLGQLSEGEMERIIAELSEK